MKKLWLMLTLTLSACVTPFEEEAKTADYGAYPAHYEAIVRHFYADIVDTNPLEVVKVSPPVKYAQPAYDDGFQTDLDLKKFPNNGHSKERLFGYLVCVEQDNHFDWHKIDAVLIKNDVIIGRIYQISSSGWASFRPKPCTKEYTQMLTRLAEARRTDNERRINNFIQYLKRSE